MEQKLANKRQKLPLFLWVITGNCILSEFNQILGYVQILLWENEISCLMGNMYTHWKNCPENSLKERKKHLLPMGFLTDRNLSLRKIYNKWGFVRNIGQNI